MKADITFKDNKFFVTGDLNVANVMSVYQQSLVMLQKTQNYTFDFSQLHACDSSVLALIVEWIKHAKSVNKAIQFQSLSKELLAIAKVAGMDKMIPMALK